MWPFKNKPACTHDWGKWSQPREAVLTKSRDGFGYMAVVQDRTCNKCGLYEYVRCPEIRSAPKETDKTVCGGDCPPMQTTKVGDVLSPPLQTTNEKCD